MLVLIMAARAPADESARSRARKTKQEKQNEQRQNRRSGWRLELLDILW